MSDVTSHDDLMQALAEIRVDMEARLEDVTDLTARVDLLNGRTLDVADGIADLDVDTATTDSVRDVAEHLIAQQVAARAQQAAADAAESQAAQTAVNVHRRHGAMAEAAAEMPVPLAQTRFYEPDGD